MFFVVFTAYQNTTHKRYMKHKRKTSSERTCCITACIRTYISSHILCILFHLLFLRIRATADSIGATRAAALIASAAVLEDGFQF